MTQERGDKLMREKINSLDPLSGGIVFGKEEAWEKLQMRIEQKPAKKIPVRYWLAAAVLLLFICVTAIYNNSSKQIVHNNAIRNNSQTNVAIAPKQLPIINQKENEVQGKRVQVIEKTSSHTRKHNYPQENVIAVVPVIPIPEIENKPDEKVVINVPASIVPSPRPMKIIHSNDLDKKDTEPEPATIAAANSPGIDLKSLPVLHINDVIHEEYEVRRVLKENRWSFIRVPFMQHGYNYDNSSEINEDQVFITH